MLYKGKIKQYDSEMFKKTMSLVRIYSESPSSLFILVLDQAMKKENEEKRSKTYLAINMQVILSNLKRKLKDRRRNKISRRNNI